MAESVLRLGYSLDEQGSILSRS